MKNIFKIIKIILEKYGYEREVPFKELIDENKGIGYPNFDSIQLHNDNKFIQEFNRIILNGIYKMFQKVYICIILIIKK